MNFAGIIHKSSEQMSYSFNEEELTINLKTGYDVEKVFIHYGDPFENGILGGNEVFAGKREEIFLKKRLMHQIWWTVTLKPEFKRCRYFFELHSGEEEWYYFEDGFISWEQMGLKGKMLQCFTVPWMNPADVNSTPDWVNKTTWYQIFPDRFCNGTPEKNGEALQPWRKGNVKNEERFGGNLEGIISKLPYLQELGITGIYLNPIFEADSNHKYDTRDYRKIDAAFGDEKIFARFVEEAHDRGLRVMLDGVFNHCGHHFAPWLDVLEKGPSSAFFHWFMINDWPFDQKKYDTRDGKFYSFAFQAGMPKLNTNRDEVIAYISDICAYWVEEYGIDGIRFDVGNEVSHKFLKCVRERLKAVKPDIYLLGEIWHDASQWLLGDEYDSVMNYPLTAGINDFFLDKSLDKEGFEYMINRCYTMYMQQNNNVLFNLLDSHDTERLMTRVEDIDIFFQQMAILFTMPGSPCIYYGTEIGMEGGFDPDCRRCMPWDDLETPVNLERRKNMKKLICLRREESSFRSLHFHFPNERIERRCVEYVKLDGEGIKTEVLLNCTEGDIKVEERGEILYCRKYKEGVLEKNGTLIRHM